MNENNSLISFASSVDLKQISKIVIDKDYDSFVIFNRNTVILFFSYKLAEQIAWRFAYGPWCLKTIPPKSNSFLENDINDFFEQYIFNWNGNEITTCVSSSKLISLKKKLIENFIFNKLYIKNLQLRVKSGSLKSTPLFSLTVNPNSLDLANSYQICYYEKSLPFN